MRGIKSSFFGGVASFERSQIRRANRSQIGEPRITLKPSPRWTISSGPGWILKVAAGRITRISMMSEGLCGRQSSGVAADCAWPAEPPACPPSATMTANSANITRMIATLPSLPAVSMPVLKSQLVVSQVEHAHGRQADIVGGAAREIDDDVGVNGPSAPGTVHYFHGIDFSRPGNPLDNAAGTGNRLPIDRQGHELRGIAPIAVPIP